MTRLTLLPRSRQARVLIRVLGRAFVLTPALAFACSSGEVPSSDEPVATTTEAVLWASTSNTMSTPRAYHAAAPLADANGRVLVCGGLSASGTYQSSCDIYDPTTNAWSAGPAMPQTRAYHTLTPLGTNSVLLAGGFNGSAVAAAQPGSAASFGAAEVITGRYLHTASPLTAGVLITGGLGAGASAAQRRNGVTWGAAGTQDRSQHAAVVLSGTQALVLGGLVGGVSVDTVSRYDSGANSWTARAAMTAGGVSSKRRNHTATLLADGSVLVVGGEDVGAGTPLIAQAIRYSPSSNTWSDAGTTVARTEHAAALVNGFVIVAGGRTVDGSTNSVQSYNPATNSWTTLDPLLTPRANFTLTVLSNNRLLAAGGLDTGHAAPLGYLNLAEVFTPLALGTACTAGTAGQCLSGRCVDGVCCDTACTAQCQACAESGSSGTCSSVSGTPRGSRSACSNGFLCVSGACATTCSGDAQCQSTRYCSGGSCLAKRAQGESCTAVNQCQSGLFCTDGVCCNAQCSGQCERCNAPSNVGTCVATSGTPVSPRSACGGNGAGTTCGSTCNGSNRTACVFPGSQTSCRAASCTAGSQTLAANCDGAGNCPTTVQDCGAYTCDAGGVACRTTCSSNSHCESGHYCDGGTCAPLRENGQDCSVDGQCDSASCVDGVCCGSASCPAGSTCAEANHRGECRRSVGTDCSAGSQCGTDLCVDGVCCTSECIGQCERCNASGNRGTCVPTSGAPVGTRAPCGGDGVGTVCGARCDGENRTSCEFPGASVTCREGNTCQNGTAVLPATCGVDGVCADSTVDCGEYACNAGATACNTTCTSDDHCRDGNYCDDGACTRRPGLGAPCPTGDECLAGLTCIDAVCCGAESCPEGSTCANPGDEGFCMRELGSTCEGNAECGSGNCVDGVCCNSACDRQCEACDNAGSVGTCTPVDGAPHGSRAVCQGGGVDPRCGPVCDGEDPSACHFPDAGSACGERACADGVETRTGTCNDGECSGATRECGAYACGAVACNTSCAGAEDCAEGFFCEGEECVPTLGGGRDCTEDAACQSGFCTDGVCCNADACQEGSVCDFSGHRGTCFKQNAIACDTNEECGSGNCVDGYCCNSACEGQCEACDVTGDEGTCSPVSGDPHGERPACDSGDEVCEARTCDGAADRDSCAGYANGADVECAPAACAADGTFTAASTCTGSGACRTPAPSQCGAYRCDDDGCLESCSDNSACADGFRCVDAECQAEAATCSEDLSVSRPVDGPEVECAPYFCTSDGTCGEACRTSADCVSGYACDTSSDPAECRPTSGSSGGESEGCGCRLGAKSPSPSRAAWLLVLGAALALRRRRAR
jgi:MYXO-CTERM domain-containing protein